MVENRERSFGNPNPDLSIPENPGWKPLLWLFGIIAALIGLGELLFIFGMEILEFLGEAIFLLVEGSEEFLEDAVEERFKLHHWEAERYTAWATSPIKLLVAVLLIRWFWLWFRSKALPVIKVWLKRQWLLVRASWRGVWWPWKSLIILVLAGFLMILI